MGFSVPDQRGRRVVITGANTGIGRVTAVALAAAGAEVTIAGRSLERTQPVIDEILSAGGQADFVPLEMTSLARVREAAEVVLADDRPIHVLINNAGLAGRRGVTDDGFELAFGVNHLAHYLWTELLLDRVRQSAPARIVNVASRAHYDAKSFPLDELQQSTRSMTGLPEYAVSKLANVLHAAELGRRLEGTGVTTYSLHPGVVATDVWREIPGPLAWVMKRFMISPERGAETTLYCATAPQAAEESGLYYSSCRVKRMNRLGEDEALARRLHEQSAVWAGLAS